MADEHSSSRLDCSRYFAVATVMLHFGMILIAFTVATALLSSPAPAWLVPTQLSLPFNVRDDLGEELAGIVKQRRAAGVAENPKAVMLGFSTTRESFDPMVFDPDNRGMPRYWNLGTRGAGFQQLHEQVELFCATGINTEVAILGIRPSYLLGRKVTYRPTDLGDVWEAAQGRGPQHFSQVLGRYVKFILRQYGWLYAHKNPIHRRIDHSLFQGRMALLRNAGIETVFEPSRDPFAAQYFDESLHREEDFLNEQMKYWEDQGHFDPAQYEDVQEQGWYFVDSIRQLQTRSSLVRLVLMPERSELRRRIPPRAEEALRTLLDEHEFDAPDVLIDLRDQFDDALFVDYIHLSARGRKVFSARLAQELDAETM